MGREKIRWGRNARRAGLELDPEGYLFSFVVGRGLDGELVNQNDDDERERKSERERKRGRSAKRVSHLEQKRASSLPRKAG